MAAETLFTSFLRELGVRHTTEYSDRRFRTMPFKTLFGFSRLLQAYGIQNAAYTLPDKSEVKSVDTPFIAQRGHAFAVVTTIANDPAGSTAITWKDEQGVHTDSIDNFNKTFTGVLLQAYPDDSSVEPDYGHHHIISMASGAKKVLLVLSMAALLVVGFIEAGLWRHVSTFFLIAVNLGGLFITWLLILKSLKVKSATADKVCGALQEHGCDHVLEDKASSFFGLFAWSEVGFAYFSVTTAVMILFPSSLGWLALINGCCLPFTLWSIWYQKFRIKTWCTLCVITQCLLWAQFLCYLLGGWWSQAFPLHPMIVVLGAAYLGALLSVNAICTFIKKRIS